MDRKHYHFGLDRNRTCYTNFTRIILYQMSYEEISLMTILLFYFCSGGRNRTSDYKVMSLICYHCNTPQYLLSYTIIIQNFSHFFKLFFTLLQVFNRILRANIELSKNLWIFSPTSIPFTPLVQN